MGGVWPRRMKPSELGPSAAGAAEERGFPAFLLLLFSGILSGGTWGVSYTGSTMAVRPLAPRQLGRDDLKAPAAGSVVPSLAAAAFLAILRTRSPNDGEAAAGLLCGDDHACELIPRPPVNCAGAACEGQPWELPVGSAADGSQGGASLKEEEEEEEEDGIPVCCC